MIRRLIGVLSCVIFGAGAMAWADGPARHVIIISIDGLHEADLTDPALKDRIPTILSLAKSGTWYLNAHTTMPSDSFPATLAYLTGAGPATTGMYYDVSYTNLLRDPQASPAELRGAVIKLTDYLDRDYERLDGGGDSGFGSLDPARMLVDPQHNNAPTYPHDYLKVNTIFEIAHAAGLRTVMMDKHPVYEIAAGPSGKGLSDLYCPEIAAKVGLVGGKIFERPKSGEPIPAGMKIARINQDPAAALAYDDLKLEALLRQIRGDDARGLSHPGPPNLLAINFQGVNIAEKDRKAGGIDWVGGREVPSAMLLAALTHTDGSIARIVRELKRQNLWDQTLLILTAKHGNNPRVGVGGGGGQLLILKKLADAGVSLGAQAVDDVGVFWLLDRSLAGRAAQAVQDIRDNGNAANIDQIYWGDSLKRAGLTGSPDRTPDLIVTLHPGYMLVDDLPKRSEHGGFVEDDVHVPLIVSGGAVPGDHLGRTIDVPVKTTQIAVTALQALGLDASKLDGARIEGTVGLP